MIVKRLIEQNFNTSALPPDIRSSIDTLSELTGGTMESDSQKVNVLDRTIFDSIAAVSPDDPIVQSIRTEIEADEQKINNDGFNTTGIDEGDVYPNENPELIEFGNGGLAASGADIKKMEVIGYVTTKPLSLLAKHFLNKSAEEKINLPEKTFPVVDVLENSKGDIFYVTNIWHKEHKGIPLVITDEIVEKYVSIKDMPVVFIQKAVLKDFQSGSSLDFCDDKIYVVGDDAKSILILDKSFNEVDRIAMFEGMSNAELRRIPKDIKQDLETSTVVNIEGIPHILILGSGANENRSVGYLVNTDMNIVANHFKYNNFVRRLKNEGGLPEVNIEGSAVVGDKFQFIILANRSNKTNPDNFLIITSGLFWEYQDTAPIHTIRLQLPDKDAGVSEICYDAGTDTLFFTATIEDTTNAIDDGKIGDSFIGYIRNISTKLTSDTIQADELIKLTNISPEFTGHKIEGICIEGRDDKYHIINLVSDNDNDQSHLFKIRLFINKKANNGVATEQVWYHGTDSSFDSFDITKTKGGPSIFGLWFTDDAELAKMFGENVYKVRLSYKNPKMITFDKWDDVRERHAKDTGFFLKWKNDLIAQGYDSLYIKERISDFAGQKVRDPNTVAIFNQNDVEFIEDEEFSNGGGIPDRYKNMGFTKVGQKKKSTRPDKKWMVLAKKGGKYKVVHGGYKGMQDYSQHHDDVRRKRFWNRMGGFDSDKANDPFSPLYWHKKFGTWDDGGEIDGEDVLLAPNGKPTNLTPTQYALVRTPEFKAWFGDWEKLARVKVNDPGIDEITLSHFSKDVSKVVDENGEPLVVYHGTKGDFSIFEDRMIRYVGCNGDGFYFSPDIYESKKYGDNVREFFLNARNPVMPNQRRLTLGDYKKIIDYIQNDEEYKEDLKNYGYFEDKDYVPFRNKLAAELIEKDDYAALFDLTHTTTGSVRYLSKALNTIGIHVDSVISPVFREYVVFNSLQIKLADGTNTTFDPNNPDVRFDDGGVTENLINKSMENTSIAASGMVVTKIKDIPNLKSKVDAGQVTYRGLGMGKIADRFYELAGETGVRIKVDGKEYFITDTDFRELNWDFQKGEWLNKIKFSAPYRKAANGVDISLLKDFDINNLDVFERRQYDDFIKHSTKEESLQILIDNVDGDYSQLSPKLAEIAELKDKAANGSYIDYIDKQLIGAGFDVKSLTQKQKELILQPSMEPETYSQDGEVSGAEAMRMWLSSLSDNGLDRQNIKKAVELNFAEKGTAIASDEYAEKHGTVFKREWKKYDQDYKSRIKYAPYEIPDKVAVFEGKEQMSVPFFKMYGTTDHIKKAFDYIENRKHISETIIAAGDEEKYPELVKPRNFEVVAITPESYQDGYRAYDNGGIVIVAANGKYVIQDIKEFYQPGKFYKHKRMGYIAKYIGKGGPKNKHTYYVVDDGNSEMPVGSMFTPNDPQRWFDIVDEQTALKFNDGGLYERGGNIHLYDIPEGSTVYEVKVKDPLYERGQKGVAESPYLYHFEYDGKIIWWHGDWNSNKHKFSKFKIVQKDNTKEVKMTPLQESLSKMRVEGNTVYLPSEQISNYTEVKNALIKAGASYKKNSFVFPKDAQPYIDRLLGGEKINLKKQFQYFGTPAKLADKVVKLAEIKPGDKVLEPSAGQGAIVDAIHRVQPEITVDVLELMEENRDILLNKNVNFIGEDFMNIPVKYRNYYDVIVANPPFSKNQDVDHIRKMYDCLKPGGRLVSLASTHWKTSSNRKENEFSSWISELGAFVEDIPPGEFKESGTGIATCIIVIDKPKKKADGGYASREDFITLENGTTYYIDKVPEKALDKRGKMSEHRAIQEGINLVFLKNFENDPDALDIAATEMEDTKQPTEAQVRRAMILKIGYEGFWYALKAGGESASDNLYSSSLSMDMEGPGGEDVEKVIIKKYNSDFNKILITEDEIREIKDKIIKFRRRGKKIRDEKVQSIMDFLVMAEARGKYNVTGGGQKPYTEQFRDRIINMIVEIADNKKVVNDAVDFRVKQHEDHLEWMGDKDCIYMIDDKYMTTERCKEETKKEKEKANRLISLWRKMEADVISSMSGHKQAAENGMYLVEVIGKELEKDGGHKHRWVKEIKANSTEEAEKIAKDDFNESWKLSDISFFSAKVITNPTERDIVQKQGVKMAEDGKNIPVMEEEDYLAMHGASRQDIGDSALHKNRGSSEKAWKRIVEHQAQKDADLISRRQKLREEYWAKVGSGELRPPTRIEKLIATAQGHPDNLAVQAARRLLEKKGISWGKSKFDKAEYGKSISGTTANNWWRHTLSLNEQKNFARKHLKSYQYDALMGSTSQYASGKHQNDLITIIWRKEGAPAYSQWLDDKYGYGDLTDVNLGMKIYYKTHPEYTGFKEKFVSSHEIMDWGKTAADGIKVGTGVFQGKENWRITDGSRVAVYPKDIYTEQQAIEKFKTTSKPIVNYINRSITFYTKEKAQEAKKKLNDFDHSLVWEYGDGEWKQGSPRNILTERTIVFANDVDFRISLNLLDLKYRDVTEFKWIFDVAWDSTTNGVPFTEDIVSHKGAEFVIYPLPFHTDEDIKNAKGWIRSNRDAVKISVADANDWDELYKSAYFKDPRTRDLKWYQIEQDEKLIRRERKKGTTPSVFVDQFVLPRIDKTEIAFRKKHGDKMYQMADGGSVGEDWQIKNSDDKYLSIGMDGKIKWNDSPDLGYTYTKDRAEEFKNELEKNMNLSSLSVVKYNKEWWKSTAANGKRVKTEETLIKKVETEGLVSGRFGNTVIYQVFEDKGTKMYQIVNEKGKKSIIDITPTDMDEIIDEDDFMADGGGVKMIDDVKLEPVHISQISAGDTIERDGKLTTVNSNHIKRDSFMGITLFGDSYNLGNKPVYKVVDWPKAKRGKSMDAIFKEAVKRFPNTLENLNDDVDTYYVVRAWDTDQDKRNNVKPEEFKRTDREQAIKIANNLHYNMNYGIVEVDDENGNRILNLDAYAKNGKSISGYEVELEALPNPDFDRNSHEGTVRVKKHMVKVDSPEQASDVVRRFIDEHDLGSGNWSGGNLHMNGKKVGYVSYNGRLWNNDGTPMK